MTAHPRHAALLCVAAWLVASASLHAQRQSSLAYPGPDGRLVYAGYANQGQTSTGNRMIDFSHAGYMGGGVAIPWVPEETALDPLPGGDDHARIQAAIDAMSTRPLSPAGFRGALLLRAGAYRVSQPLRVNADGIVIRGEGQHAGGTVIQFTATVQSNLFNFSGSGGWTKIAGTETPITGTLVPSGARSFNVASSAGLSVGDRIIVHRTPNQAWIDLLQMGQYGWTPEGYRIQTPRVITAIDGNTITVDAPLVHASEAQHGGGEVYRYHFNGALRQVGIETLRLESAYTSNTDENHGWNAVVFSGVENGWARRVTARHFGYSCVTISGGSQFLTVEDCAQLDPKSIITGGRRYSFNLGQASFVLMQRCYTREGRHDYVTGARVPGPNVFVDSLAQNVHSDTGPHHRYAVGLLFDNIRGGPINVQNRRTSGTGHGWAGAQTVFWNCHASTMICDAPQAAMNFSIGCIGTQQQGQWPPGEPDGIWESRGLPVIPRSLYYAQLADRLGHHAVANVTTSTQQQGTIWNQLSAWKGDTAAPGLPAFAPVGVDPGAILYAEAGTPVAIGAVLRYPLPADFKTTHTWRKASGPGDVTFDNPQDLFTTARFSANGSYKLECEVIQDNGDDPYTGTGILTVLVGHPPPPTDPSIKIWTGSADTSWAMDANWNTIGAPAADQNAVFNSASGSGFSNHIGTSRTIKSITFDSTTGATPYLIHLADGLALPINTTTTRKLTFGSSGGVTVRAGHHTIKGLAPGSGTAGDLKLANGMTFNIAANSSLTVEARLTQTGSTDSYTTSGPGTLVLKAHSGGSSAWNFNGGVFTVVQGTLELASSGSTGHSGNNYAVSNGATVELSVPGAYGSNNGTLTLNGTGVGGVGALHASATTTINSGTGSIVLASNSRIGVAEDQTLTLNQHVAGSGGRELEKSGSGTLTLGGANTYTGATTVAAGTLVIGAGGSITHSASITIAAGATLDTTAQPTFAIPSGQPLTFGINAAGSGTAGRIAAAGLDLTTAVVAYHITGTPDDPVYVLATYSGALTGAEFASAPEPPTGYTLEYDYEGNQIALVLDARSPYEAWADAAAFGNDENGDGFSNGLAFLLGAAGPDDNALDLLPAATETNGGLVLTFSMLNATARGGATLDLQHSADPGSSNKWTTVAVPDTSGGPFCNVLFTVTPIPDSPLNSVVATIDASPAAGGRLFGRLKAEENP